MPFKVIQGHRFWYQSKARMRLPISEWYIIIIIIILYRIQHHLLLAVGRNVCSCCCCCTIWLMLLLLLVLSGSVYQYLSNIHVHHRSQGQIPKFQDSYRHCWLLTALHDIINWHFQSTTGNKWNKCCINSNAIKSLLIRQVSFKLSLKYQHCYTNTNISTYCLYLIRARSTAWRTSMAASTGTLFT